MFSPFLSVCLYLIVLLTQMYVESIVCKCQCYQSKLSKHALPEFYKMHLVGKLRLIRHLPCEQICHQSD
jgi:hypothetical protein